MNLIFLKRAKRIISLKINYSITEIENEVIEYHQKRDDSNC